MKYNKENSGIVESLLPYGKAKQKIHKSQLISSWCIQHTEETFQPTDAFLTLFSLCFWHIKHRKKLIHT